MSVVRSMTGFGQAQRTLDDGRSVSVRVKAVNARHLEVQVRVPAGLDSLESELRGLVKSSVRRGHVELTVYLERAGAAGRLELNEALLLLHVDAHRRAAKLTGVASEPDLNHLLRINGVMAAAESCDADDSVAPVLRDAARDALEQFQAARAQEGEALAAELRSGAARLLTMVDEAAALRAGVTLGVAERLRAKLAELAEKHVEIAPERVLAEAALLAARGDVEEELVRLRTHLARLRELLDAGGEAGKPLEFLLQELGRETNTLLSKTGGAAGADGLRLTDLGLAMKVELERAREQVMNLE